MNKINEQLPLHGISVYNPSLLSQEEIKRYFIARHALLKQLLDGLQYEQTGIVPQHRLLVGTRGMGKTTLLHRLALAVTEDKKLSSHWLPLNFPEEQYNISHLSDFWVNCLDALGDTLEKLDQSQMFNELDNCITQLPTEEKSRAKQALRALLEFSTRLNKRLILLVDNLDIVLERLTESHWAIREVLGHEPKLLLIGASAGVLEATFRYDAAFYDFFKIHELRGLSEYETREIFGHLATMNDDRKILKILNQQPERLKTLHTLTGGNPRTTILLYGVLMQGIEGDVRSDLERLLDQCTPLYKARFEELSPQSQKVVDAMAIHWDPISAAILAEQTRLPVNTISTQLTRLQNQGVVEKVILKPGKKNGFQIAERFFNIWYLMRASRRVRRRLVWLVQFLKIFYKQDELYKHAQKHLEKNTSIVSEPSVREAEYGFSLASAIEEPIMKRALEISSLKTVIDNTQLRQQWNNIIDFDDDDKELKNYAERLKFMKELPEKVIASRKHWPKGVNAQQFAEMLQEALNLTPNEKHSIMTSLPTLSNEQILETQNNLIKYTQFYQEVFLQDDDLLNALKQAIQDGTMKDIQDFEEARITAKRPGSERLGAFADLMELELEKKVFSLDELNTLEQQLFQYNLNYGWNILGGAFYNLGDLDRAISTCRQQIKIKPDHENAWYNLGIVLENQGNLDEASSAYRQQIKVKPNHENVWNNLGIIFYHQGNLGEAISAYRQQIKVKPNHENAWSNLGLVLESKGDLDGAISAFHQQIEVKPNHESAWNNLGVVLENKGDLDEAVSAYRQQIEIKPDHKNAWYNLGAVLANKGDLDGAISAYRQGIQHPTTKGACHNGLAWIYLLQQENLKEAEALAREAVQLNPEDISSRHTLASILINNNNWIEATREAKEFLRLSGEDWLDTHWDEFVLFFRIAVAKDYAKEAVTLLQEIGEKQRLQSLYVALKTIAYDENQLTQVAPEIRQPAKALIPLLKRTPFLYVKGQYGN